ncbi:MAG: PAS domain S-box protein [Fidelibacterota bacterium]
MKSDQSKTKAELIKELQLLRDQISAESITAQDLTEKELVLQEAELRATLYSIGDAVIATNRKGHIVRMNPVAEDLTDWSEKEALGNPLGKVFRVIDEKSRKKINNPVMDVLKRGTVTPLAGHILLISKDGKEVPITNTSAPIRNHHGEITGVVLVFRDRTEQRKIQREVEEAKKYAESIVATIREPLVVLDSQLKVISANRAFYRTFKVNENETVQKYIYDLGNRQWDIPKLRKLLEEILPQNTTFNDFEVEHKFEHIGTRIMLLNARRFYHKTNKTQLILLAIEDVTERRLSEKEVRESEERFRSLAQTATDGVIIINAKGKIRFFNQASERMFGYSSGEIIDKKVTLLIPNEFQKKHIAGLARYLKTGKPVVLGKTLELTGLRKDGSKLPIELSLSEIQTGGEKAFISIIRDISERKIAEEALQKSHELLQKTHDTLLDAIISTDLDFNIVSCNKAVEKMFGYTPDELIGKNYLFLVPQAMLDDPKRKGSQEKLFQKGFFRDDDFYFRKKNGDLFPARFSVAVTRDEKGNPTGLVGSVHDITDRKKAEEELRESEERYRSILENIKEGYYEVDLKGNFTFFNDSVCKMLNYSRDELMGMNYRQYMDSESSDIVFSAFNEVYKTNNPSKTIDFKIKGNKGKIRYGEISITLLKGRSNKPVGFRGIVRDVTERKQAEEKLRESEEKFRSIYESSIDVYYRQDKDRLITMVSPSVRQFGYEPEELIGTRGLEYYFAREDRDQLNSLLEKEGLVKDYETKLKDANGNIVWVSMNVRMLRDDRGNFAGIEGVLRDITERKRDRERLEKALEDAQRAERVKSLFLANMSHEIRTPLNAILGFTELIEASTRHLVGEEEREFFDTIKSSGERLMHTVHEILDISQIEAGTYDLKQERLDLVKLVGERVSEFQRAAREKSLQMAYQTDLDTAFILADPYGISQSISNIIDNAVKYTEEGQITVSLGHQEGQYVLTIRDTGIGISQEYLDSLYEAFSQESEGYTKRFQGIGLGMAIAKRHLDLNQVGIAVESAKGEGTTFTLTFQPARKSRRKQPEEKAIVVETPVVETEERPLVLLVEDDPNSRRLVEFFLKGRYRTSFAESVAEAKEELKQEPVALVLLDLSLVGDEDGLDLVRWMRKTKRWRQTPVIATTAHAFTTDRDNCLAAGCNDYLAKPLDRKKLILMMRQQLVTQN